MKKLFFVIGPESSGTRLITRILCESGCFGDYDHYQRLDEFVTDHNEDLYSIIGDSKLIVFRRSVPHGGEFPDFKKMFYKFYSKPHKIKITTPYIIVTTRNIFELCKSKMNNNGKESIEDAYESFQLEMRHIFKEVIGFDHILFFNTSFLFKFPEISLKSLSTWSGLDISVEKVISFLYDADKNHQICHQGGCSC
jgi:hypothetical protein